MASDESAWAHRLPLAGWHWATITADMRGHLLFVTPLSPFMARTGAELPSALMLRALQPLGDVDVLQISRGATATAWSETAAGQAKVLAGCRYFVGSTSINGLAALAHGYAAVVPGFISNALGSRMPAGRHARLADGARGCVRHHIDLLPLSNSMSGMGAAGRTRVEVEFRAENFTERARRVIEGWVAAMHARVAGRNPMASPTL